MCIADHANAAAVEGTKKLPKRRLCRVKKCRLVCRLTNGRYIRSRGLASKSVLSIMPLRAQYEVWIRVASRCRLQHVVDNRAADTVGLDRDKTVKPMSAASPCIGWWNLALRSSMGIFE